MNDDHPLSGVYAAALTPFKPDYSPDPTALPILLDFLARRGCHGALLFGTTGEGPSLAPQERLTLLHTAMEVRQIHPGFRLLVGTGTPSLEETVELTRAAFEIGADGVVVLPPYYYRKVSDEGLYLWYSQVIKRAIPQGKALLGYHIPAVSGVPLSLDLLARLKDTYPDRFAGIKDSSAEADHALQLGKRFGKDLLVLNGTDRLFTLALQAGASGCITALANLFSPNLRRIWEAHQRGEEDSQAQERLNAARSVSEKYPPAPPLLKLLLARWHHFPLWQVRPPLLPVSSEVAELVINEMTVLQYG